MADTDGGTTVASEPSQPERLGVVDVLENVPAEDTPLEESKAQDLPSDSLQEVDSPGPARSPVNTIPPGLTSSSTTHLSQPKRFSAVNINKKFLEKNSSASGSNQPSPSSVAAKSGASVARPTAQPTTPHSRLVTTKLTAGPQSSSVTGSSWSRPSSATPPVPPTASSMLNAPAPLPLTSAPQLPHVGKVIQPQPRMATSGASAGASQKDSSGSSKPAWGNVKAAAANIHNSTVRSQNDFPTAAEVAQVRKTKLNDTKETADIVAAHKQARMEEADTFRGVHLDPNAHHWDEMEEDDDNFLDGVIEFGDGRQYKIQSAELPQSSSPTSNHSRSLHPGDGGSSQGDASATTYNVSVSKEERFADDFDRSWPRSKPSPSIPQRDFSGHAHPPPSSSTSSQAAHSSQESSRVLFNERSNRLEPYSNVHASHRPSQPPYPSKKGTQSDVSSSPTESRSSRDFPPHGQAQNVQLLQKRGSSSDFPLRSTGGFEPGSSWNRDSSRRDDMPPSHGPPFDPKRSRDQHSSFGPSMSSSGHRERDRDPGGGNRGTRGSIMGPPPLPPPHHTKDSGRQIPPHLSQMPPTSPPRRRPPPLDPHVRFPTSSESFGHPPVLSPTQSSSTSQVATVPVYDNPPLLSGISDVDMEEVRKDVMQSAAARAKERRKQEEEEREKEKERARKKALELEERIKATEIERTKASKPEQEASEAEVNKVIEDAINEVPPGTASRRTSSVSHPAGNNPRRPPSLKGIPRQPLESSRPRRTSQSSAGPSSTTTPAMQADSWRSKTSPFVSATTRPTQAMDPVVPFPAPLLHHDDALTVDLEEELEVVDFSDLGKFFGVSDSTTPDPEDGQPDHTSYPPRPTASDYFEDKFESGGRGAAWKRKTSHDAGNNQPPIATHNEERPDATQLTESLGSDAKLPGHVDTTWNNTQHTPPPFPVKDATTTVDHRRHSAASSHTFTQPNSGSQRTPRAATFSKEADMSAWDDALSRIKGALNGMQSGDVSKGQHVGGSADAEVPSIASASSSLPPPHIHPKSPKELKWVPPALRGRRSDADILSPENFNVTGCEPPRSPPKILVQLPAVSRRLAPLHKRQFHQARLSPGQVRWDILSWDPPVEGMSRRDFSLNDVLFRKPYYKGKDKFRVSLPTSKLKSSGTIVGAISPKANLPANVGMPKFLGAFGRPSGVDNLSTWRKPKSPSLKNDMGEVSPSDATLNPTSKSPPPELPSNAASATPTPKPDVSISAKGDSSPVSVRPKSQPKMPAGSAVAFYRDSRIDVVGTDVDTSVKFIVNSELDEQLQTHATPLRNPIITLSSPNATESTTEQGSGIDRSTLNGLKSQPTSPEFAIPSLVQSKSESKSSDDSADRAPITPPTHHASATWAKSPLTSFNIKESPARPPDPEHLKAVWSQAPDKGVLPAVNSLEGIADDLTALPFTLQDVKSEDGETPPPSIPSVPSRMSLHDVTRAFQQVPTSSSSANSTHRSTPLSPTPMAAPLVQRQPGYAYAFPPQLNHNMRPTFAPYSSPILTSPSSPMMYPHPMTTSPVPNRMTVNGHAPLYGQSMWVPLSAGPQAQNPNRMIRPLASPYSTPLMQYPSPSPTIYAPPPPGTVQNPPQQNGSQPRGRMPVMSPVMSHASPHPSLPMYAASPVLMHAPVMQLPQGHAYMSMPPGRRNDNVSGHSPMQQPAVLQSPSHNNGYAPVPSTSFVRPTW